MSEVDPDPHLPAEEQGRATLGGREEPGAGDPTEGGKRGQIGEAPSIAADEPADGGSYAPGGGRVEDEKNAPPVADPGPDA
ncbi:hypothetical protein [Geodermatophilus sp. SYSU D00815]